MTHPEDLSPSTSTARSDDVGAPSSTRTGRVRGAGRGRSGGPCRVGSAVLHEPVPRCDRSGDGHDRGPAPAAIADGRPGTGSSGPVAGRRGDPRPRGSRAAAAHRPIANDEAAEGGSERAPTSRPATRRSARARSRCSSRSSTATRRRRPEASGRRRRRGCPVPEREASAALEPANAAIRARRDRDDLGWTGRAGRVIRHVPGHRRTSASSTSAEAGEPPEKIVVWVVSSANCQTLLTGLSQRI
jgi:hypothetical protein